MMLGGLNPVVWVGDARESDQVWKPKAAQAKKRTYWRDARSVPGDSGKRRREPGRCRCRSVLMLMMWLVRLLWVVDCGLIA